MSTSVVPAAWSTFPGVLIPAVAGIILLIGLIVLFVRLRARFTAPPPMVIPVAGPQNVPLPAPAPFRPAPPPPAPSQAAPPAMRSEVARNFSQREAVGSRVVATVPTTDGTLQFLPGRLEVVDGERPGQDIRFVRTWGEIPEITF